MTTNVKEHSPYGQAQLSGATQKLHRFFMAEIVPEISDLQCELSLAKQVLLHTYGIKIEEGEDLVCGIHKLADKLKKENG